MPVAQWTYSIAPPLEVTRATPELQVEVLDVEGEDLLGAGGGLVEHPPQDPLAQAVPVVGEQLLQAGAGDGPIAAAGGLAALQPPGGVGGQDLVAPAQAVKEVSADRCRFQVAAAAPSHRPITAA